MEIENKIVSAVVLGIKTLYGQDIAPETVQLQKTKKEFAGHLTLVVFPFLKISRKKPEDTAQEIGHFLKTEIPSVVADFNAVKGFLNLVIAPASWIGLSAISIKMQFGLARNDRPFAVSHDRILFPQHQQAFAFGTCPQQSVRMRLGQHHGSQWQSRGEDQYRERPRHTYLQKHVGVAEIRERCHSGKYRH